MLASAALAFATFYPLATSAIEPTIPALQSYWLLYHIMTLFVAYGAFAASFGLGILYLIKTGKSKKNEKNNEITRIMHPIHTMDTYLFLEISTPL